MKCCGSCLLLFFVVFGVITAISVVQAYWPIMLGLGLSWASLRYIKRYQETH